MDLRFIIIKPRRATLYPCFITAVICLVKSYSTGDTLIVHNIPYSTILSIPQVNRWDTKTCKRVKVSPVSTAIILSNFGLVSFWVKAVLALGATWFVYSLETVINCYQNTLILIGIPSFSVRATSVGSFNYLKFSFNNSMGKRNPIIGGFVAC